jgi:Spy/CpxP family protein refolding chaperone
MILPLLLVILVSFSANAECGGNKGWQWWENEPIEKELGLSQDQLAKTKEISTKFDSMLEEAGKNYNEKKTAYRDAKSNPDASKGDVIKAFDSMWDSKYKMMRIKLDRDLDMKGVLTPEQVTKLSEIKKEHKEKMMKEHHKMMDKKPEKK